MAGVSQPSPLLAARQHADALAVNGDPASAHVVLEDAIAAGRSTLGEDDPGVLAAMHQLARLHQQADDPMPARRILEEAYAAGQWRLGDADPLMLEISYDLGTVAAELGNRHEARKAFARVADTGATVLGADHWAVARARAYLGDESPTVRTDAAPPPEAGLDQAVPSLAQRLPASAREAEQSLPGRYQFVEQPAWDSPAEPTARQPVIPAPSEPFQPAAQPAPPPPRRSPAARRPTAPHRRGSVVALVLVLASHQSNSKDNVPTVSGRPPTDVRLEDHGSDVSLTWTDPAAGRTTFLITGARPGEVLRPMGQVGPGQTSYELHGLNANLEYCFAIVAVYSTTELAPSAQACTSRLRTATPK
jgi:tetratricopeptide repeat protein